MQDGAIAEMGSHDVLMAQGGVYARLHASALLQPSTQIKD
jgi:ABC-type multidrug transport system fused ATPase/permease subunit